MYEYVPLKKKTVRENYAPFITKDLRKAIYRESRLKKKLVKTLQRSTKNYTKDSVMSLFQSEIIHKTIFF